jgi:hypothetical protein
MTQEQKEKAFEEFYQRYLVERSDKLSRRLHFIGMSLFFFCLLGFFFTAEEVCLMMAPVLGLTFSWLGTFVIDKKFPKHFRHPIQSLKSDLRLFLEIFIGKYEVF